MHNMIFAWFHGGRPMDRLAKAHIRSHEVRALYQLSLDPSHPVSKATRQQLFSKNLVKLDAGQLSLTDDGSECLRRDQGRLLIQLLEARLTEEP